MTKKTVINKPSLISLSLRYSAFIRTVDKNKLSPETLSRMQETGLSIIELINALDYSPTYPSYMIALERLRISTINLFETLSQEPSSVQTEQGFFI
ncbi:MAG: hypothetical protein KDD61_03875 [Bdellovibrionales bacterium]|nr:hypothetical protein [Bdellovibrionales bacterium]